MNNNGIIINMDNNELIIKGHKDELLELAEYINNIALSEEEKDHIHLDELTIIDKDSNIKNIIIEKV